HYVLVKLSIIMAPFTPFLAEELYQKLTGGESVHLLDWPEVGHIDEIIVRKMEWARNAINQGLSQRAAVGIKVRQPLALVSVYDQYDMLDENLREVISEELNVKEVVTRKNLDTDINMSLLEQYLAKVPQKPIAILDLN